MTECENDLFKEYFLKATIVIRDCYKLLKII